jgi:hypothetical protein
VEYIALISVVNISVSADRAQATLPCSITLGCEVVLPPGERIEHVSIGDQRYSVTIASYGSEAPARILINPNRNKGEAGETKLDIVDAQHSYTVLVAPTTERSSRVLSFVPPPAPVPTPPIGETLMLNPSKMIFGAWRYQGDPLLACMTLFEYAATIWCRLPPNTIKTPSIYGVVGKVREPIDARMVDRTYLVIQSIDGPFEVDLTLGGTEHHGKLEHI